MDKESEIWTLQVGQPFTPERTEWDPDSFEYRYFNGNHLLQICVASPSSKEIEAFSEGAVRIGLYVEHGVIFFIFKLEGVMAWSDQAFSIHLVHQANQEIPAVETGKRIGLSLVLVDANNGLVSALRFVTLSPHYSQVFYRELRRQAAEPFNIDNHNRSINLVYKTHPESRSLARAALFIERPGAL